MSLQHGPRVLHNGHKTKIRNEGHAFIVYEYVGLIYRLRWLPLP